EVVCAARVVNAAPLYDNEQGVFGGAGVDRVVIAGLDRGGRGNRPAQVPKRRTGDPEQEEVEHCEKAELERDGDRLEVVHCSISKAKQVVPRVTSSPGASRAESTRRPLTLIPLVEPRSTTCQSPVLLRRSCACLREMFGSLITHSHSFDRP